MLASKPCRHRRSPIIWFKILITAAIDISNHFWSWMNEIWETYVIDSFLRVVLTLLTTWSRTLLQKRSMYSPQLSLKKRKEWPHTFGVLEQASWPTLWLFSPSTWTPNLVRIIISTQFISGEIIFSSKLLSPPSGSSLSCENLILSPPSQPCLRTSWLPASHWNVTQRSVGIVGTVSN